MTIGIIGWGSLIWAQGDLELGSAWFADGPVLSLEFARISQRDRATLVISEHGAPQQTYWAYAASDDLDDVVKALAIREGTPRIDFALANGTASGSCPADVRTSMNQWFSEHPDIRACVWTGLRSNWLERRSLEFSVEDGLRYLAELPNPSNAREYIENAPAQIQTPLRELVRERLGWMDARLPDHLFAKP